MTKTTVRIKFVEIFCRILQSPVREAIQYTDHHPIQGFQ